jgi:hypothetical protein
LYTFSLINPAQNSSLSRPQLPVKNFSVLTAVLMESIAALGLASNIFQIIDFASRTISHSRELYNSEDGRSHKHAALLDTSQRFSKIYDDLRITGGYNPRAVTNSDKQLFDLKKESEKVVGDLKIALEKARLKEKNRWQSFYLSLANNDTDEEISRLANLLEVIRKQVETVVLISIRYVTTTK